ncbi:hypothetical protein FNW02_22205 [Komarekiella sp. 'clone 1']|uniref:Uncharacterized protein n=1 Tax=Komarekiella delphini-convector SJRDD-AB1 TaxID=2593771 RepID=A0AA40VST0_9NOST|nr:hypothetical protein [Komarekiella delphini-convector]MBD6618462.1 hypothetical protein [Komarekiella delphini-convector SJRDD-AB1]
MLDKITNKAEFSALAINTMIKWVLEKLPLLNEEVYAEKQSPQELAIILNNNILNIAPYPENVNPDDAKKLLVILGIFGSSIERHTQQCFIKKELKAVECREKTQPDVVEPGKGLDLLLIRNSQSFINYFQQIADIIGHPYRDSFFTFIECNGPTVQVMHPKNQKIIHNVPALFSDGCFVTFSGQKAEIEFISLLKKSFAIQEAANEHLEYLQKTKGLNEPQAIEAALNASILMLSIKSNLVEFMKKSQFNTDFFLDILRQYACSWYPINQYLKPPSGANDYAVLHRDIMLFEDLMPPHGKFIGYKKHIQEVFSVLMPNAIKKLENSMNIDSIESKIFQALGINKETFNHLTENVLLLLLQQNYWLVAYLQLYNAQKILSHVHYSSIQKYLVRPKISRDISCDRREVITVVSNSYGTTGMSPKGILWLLDQARANHPLARMNSGVKLKQEINILLNQFDYKQLKHTELLSISKFDN